MNEVLNNKIFLIGLDGAEWNVINPLMDRGLLPNLQKLVNAGVAGDLVSAIPPITPTAWASFLTGVTPGKHGIFSYQKKSAGENSYFISPLNSLDIKQEHLWHILGRHGKKVSFVNVPMSFPPQKVNGHMITGMMTPSTKSKFTYPDELKSELENNGVNYRIDLEVGKEANLLNDPAFHEKYFLNDKCEGFFKELYELTEQRFRAIKYLMANKPWDFFMGVFIGMDRIQHYLWQYLEDGINGKSSVIADKIFSYYSHLDNMLGELMLLAGEEATIIVMSDHGFGKYKGDFLTNRWLLEQGYLNIRKEQWKIIPWLKSIAYKSGLRTEMLSGLLGQKKVSSLRMSMQQIDWSSSKAFCVLSHGIHLNVKGRETMGCVEPGEEYEKLREDIIGGLYSIKDPVTGKPVIKKVYKREEIYSGSELDSAPDLILLSSDTDHYGIYSSRHSHDSIFYENTWKTGDHRQNGIFITKGRGLRNGVKINDAHIIDVLPTILYMYDLPIPEYVDGKVLSKIFKNPDREIRSETNINQKNSDEGYAYDEKEAEDVKDRLKQLGYID